MRVRPPSHRRLIPIAVVLALLTACTPNTPPPASPTPSPTPREFTVITTGEITTADPAMALSDTDSILINSVYQRLMTVLPSTGELKPDAATDCLFTSKLVYECTLPENLVFHNGHTLDSADVRFSLQRALRLNTADTSVGLLAALRRIETPDAYTIKFHLSWADNQFGYALAAQAASIVDAEAFDPDAALPLDTLPVGSGPFQVESIEPELTRFSRFEKYLGPRTALLPALRLAVVADSVAAEAAIADGSADVVWRSLDNAALQRLTDEIAASPERVTEQGFSRLALPGFRIARLVWNPDSRRRAKAVLRQGIAAALQADRTLGSLVPVGVTDHASAFAVGGRPELPELNGQRINLVLGYDSSAPGHADLARLLRDRIESLDGVSVRLVSSGAADLWLTDAPAWVNTATGWLQRYLAYPLPGSETKLAALELRARTTTGAARTAALTELQQQAAVDATVLPVSQGEGILFLGKGVKLIGEGFGSGQTLGLWAITNG